MGFMQSSAIPKISNSIGNKKKKKRRPATGGASVQGSNVKGRLASGTESPAGRSKLQLVREAGPRAGTPAGKLNHAKATRQQRRGSSSGDNLPPSKAPTPKFSKVKKRSKGKGSGGGNEGSGATGGEGTIAGGSAVRAARFLAKSEPERPGTAAPIGAGASASSVDSKAAVDGKPKAEEEKQPPQPALKTQPAIAAVPSSPRNVLSPLESPRSQQKLEQAGTKEGKDPLLDSLRNQPTRNNRVPPLSAEVSPRGPP